MKKAVRQKIVDYIMSGECPTHLMPMYRWYLQRRPEQICPTPIPLIWFLLGGRGSGKTWTASNHIYDYCINLPWTPENSIVYIALVGATFDDVKHTMVEGKSGLLNVVPEENVLAWNRTVGELKFFIKDGENYREVRANTYTSERPEKLRGPNTHICWLDEMAKFKDADQDPTLASTTFDNMMKGLRLGTNPHVIVTGTPTPCKLVRYLQTHPDAKLSKMDTRDNAKNLPDSFLAELLRGEGSRTFRQEVMAEVLLDNPDAIFSQEMIDANRASVPEDAEKIYKVLGYDPAASSAAEADECGIFLTLYTPEVKMATRDSGGRPIVIRPVHAYPFRDYSGHFTPSEQVQKVIKLMLNEDVDDLVFEQNQGVEFVMGALEQAIKDNTMEYAIRKQSKPKKTDYGVVKRFLVSGVKQDGAPFKFMIYAIHAVSGKQLRAEMVSTRYDSNQVHHPDFMPTCEIRNCGANVEQQMTSWDPISNKNSSPDRLDALVYTLLHIFNGSMMTRSKVTIARPPDVDQMSSQHGAVKQKPRGLAGIYSIDVQVERDHSNPADRGMGRYLSPDGRQILPASSYGRDVR